MNAVKISAFARGCAIDKACREWIGACARVNDVPHEQLVGVMRALDSDVEGFLQKDDIDFIRSRFAKHVGHQ